MPNYNVLFEVSILGNTKNNNKRAINSTQKVFNCNCLTNLPVYYIIVIEHFRKSEILYARWEDVDFKNGTLFTDKTFTGRPELRIQDLRHSFANFLVSIGINQRDLRTILGHYKPETLALVRNNFFENKKHTRGIV